MVSLDSPLALYSIPAAFLTAFYPHVKLSSTIRGISGWNNVSPRGNLDKFKESKKVPADLIAKLERMKGAHTNGLETFPIWAAGILAGTFAGVDNYTLNTYSLAFITIRTLYNYAYINIQSQALSAIRSLLWTASVAVPFVLIHKAAQAIAAN